MNALDRLVAHVQGHACEDLPPRVREAAKVFILDAIGVGHVIQDELGLASSVVVLDPYTNPDFVTRIGKDQVDVF